MDLFVQMYLAGPNHSIDRKVIDRLDEALRLENDEHCHVVARYLNIVRSSELSVTTHDRLVAVAKALPVIATSAPLRTRWGVDFDIGALAQNLLRQGQGAVREAPPAGKPCGPFARAVWELARALADSSWLRRESTQGFLGILFEIPDFWKIQRAIYAIGAPTTSYDERQVHRDFLINALSRKEGTINRSGSSPGSRPLSFDPIVSREFSPASASRGRGCATALFGSSFPWPSRSRHAYDHYSDPVWHKTNLSTQQDGFKTRMQAMPDIPAELATRCMCQALQVRPQHIETISDRLVRITNHSCIRLSNFLADDNKKNLLTDSCWADLLFHLLRVR